MTGFYLETNKNISNKHFAICTPGLEQFTSYSLSRCGVWQPQEEAACIARPQASECMSYPRLPSSALEAAARPD